MPFACVSFTSILDKPWISGIPSKKQARYQPITNFTYWLVLVSYNNWNIIHLTPKSTPFEAFNEIHQVYLDGISDNMTSLVQPDMYGSINIDDNKKCILYYSIHIRGIYATKEYKNWHTSYFYC